MYANCPVPCERRTAPHAQVHVACGTGVPLGRFDPPDGLSCRSLHGSFRNARVCFFVFCVRASALGRLNQPDDRDARRRGPVFGDQDKRMRLVLIHRPHLPAANRPAAAERFPIWSFVRSASLGAQRHRRRALHASRALRIAPLRSSAARLCLASRAPSFGGLVVPSPDARTCAGEWERPRNSRHVPTGPLGKAKAGPCARVWVCE